MSPFPPQSDINEYIRSLSASARVGDQVVWRTVLDAHDAVHADPARPWPEAIRAVLAGAGIERLYAHQVRAIDLVREGRHVVVATPTASGKSLIYHLPVLEHILNHPEARALYLFPLKALAQDQLRSFGELADRSPGISATRAIYDGDTTDWNRKKIRNNPPNVLLTNPEMLHLSLLPHHHAWSEFFQHLAVVVVDEMHTYRGIMGSHMAQVFRRLLRVCAHWGSAPVFVFCSATVGNPGELARDLTGLPAQVISDSGAGAGRKHLVLMDPNQGPVQTAILLLRAALHRGLRTIVYCQSRKLTELMALWAGSRSGRFAEKIAAYRAGFLPEERRDIEARLTSGDLLAVISTSALELGIDIGDLDLCLLVGYPGTIVATWQRAGRVGRSGQDAAVILVGGEDALDQYFLRHPLELVSREPESAVVNPHNADILRRHLVCAAAELPLAAADPWLSDPEVRAEARWLTISGDLNQSADGDVYYAKSKRPHHELSLRGTGSRFAIINAATGTHLGEVDGFRAFRETHPGAVYLHNGETHLVRSLDPDTRVARVERAKLDYYTRARSVKDTEILEITGQTTVRGTRMFVGRLRVTDQVTGYETLRIHGRKKLTVTPLDLPPQIFETEGLWFEIPREIQAAAEERRLHFMGGIHAIEHAAIGIFPLLVMSDRNDLGGISTPHHPQVGRAAVFIYDGIPGGAGIARQAFHRGVSLLDTTLRAIADCPCTHGCPSCVHSPKCGSGNRPIDKEAAVFLLETIRNAPAPSEFAGVALGPGFKPAPTMPSTMPVGAGLAPAPTTASFHAVGGDAPRVAETRPVFGKEGEAGKDAGLRYGVLDIETRYSADEVGGWGKADRMGVSCAVYYDSADDRYHEYLQEQLPELVARLREADVVVGFNIKRFDYKVLSGLHPFDFQSLNTLDILEKVHQRLGYRLSLDHLGRVTLGARKTADGLQALRWWKEGRIRDIIDYCRVDVEVTRDLYRFGRDNGHLLFENKAKQVVRVVVEWA